MDFASDREWASQKTYAQWNSSKLSDVYRSISIWRRLLPALIACLFLALKSVLKQWPASIKFNNKSICLTLEFEVYCD